MKNSSQPFVRFINLFRILNKEIAKDNSQLAIHQEAVAILAFVFDQNEANVLPTITKVVQELEFGTPPTIQRRLGELFALDFLDVSEGQDKRHRLLKVTPSGEAYLSHCSKLLQMALEPYARGSEC